MSGELRPDATSRIEDETEASQVYARGFFGTPDGPHLALDRTETAYLVEMERLELRDARGQTIPWSAVYRRALRADPGFPVRYLVYRDLRQRGYVVRAAPWEGAFSLLPRGGTLHKTPARYWVVPVSERTTLSVRDLAELRRRAQSARKSVLLAVIDEESDLTYYRVRGLSPKGAHPVPVAAAPVPAYLARDRAYVLDPEGVELLGARGGFGSRVGRRLELSLLEAAYLAARRGVDLRDATTHRRVPAPHVERRGAKLDPDFRVRLRTYADLRDRGLVVKTGFKYGAHFRAYVRDPSSTHARYLVRAVPTGFATPWPLVAGSVRLAQGVRKEYVYAVVGDTEPPEFLSLERIRP